MGIVLCGCQPVAKPPKPPEVTVARPIQQEVTDYSYFSGTMEASDRVEIRARVRGFLNKVNIPKVVDSKEIWNVEEGDVLFEIEPEPFKAEVDAVNARLEQSKAALALAKANVDRYEQLVNQQATSRQEYETKVAEHLVAKAAILVNEAAIEQAKIDLGYTKIFSPISGRVDRNLVDAGNLVGGTEATLLTTVNKMDPMYVYFDVSEQVVLEYLRWKREHGSTDADPTVHLKLEDEKDYLHEGVLDYLENQIDPATGTAMIRGVFPNPDGVLYPGLFVLIRIPKESMPDTVLVEEQAIGTNLKGKYVYVVDKDNMARQRSIELGALIDGMRVVREGLSADESYIISGLQRARPGLPVTPQPAKPAETPVPPKSDLPDDQQTPEQD